MVKHKVSLLFRIKHVFVYHPWLKVVSLVLAVIVWFYVKGKIAYITMQ
jgi:hypothetical protein